MKFPKITFWRVVFVAIMMAGAYSTYVRFFKGLGAVSNMNDQFPWGIWIGFDVLCGVMLAAGAFCVTGAVHILNIERLHDIVRPTILTAFLGYVLVICGLMFDLGRPWYIWHQLIYYNPHSVMFEVGFCVMFYTTVLALEFSPVVLERFHLTKAIKVIKAALIPLVILGVVLSTLHQSSLGTLYLIVPSKLHPFWYSPALPFFFFISAIAVGLSMTIFESSLSSRVFHRQLELPIIQELGRALLIVLCVYSLIKVEDLIHRHQFMNIFKPSYEAKFLWLELAMSIVIPITMLSIRWIRKSPKGLYWASVCTLLGFVTNRLNIAITGIEASAGQKYIPKWTEYSITLSIIAMGFFIFAMAVKYLPVFPDEHESAHTPAQPTFASPTPLVQEEEPVHVN
jgi:Ni/Fe-hydrogenase subunit HybB-like protein